MERMDRLSEDLADIIDLFENKDYRKLTAPSDITEKFRNERANGTDFSGTQVEILEFFKEGLTKMREKQ